MSIFVNNQPNFPKKISVVSKGSTLQITKTNSGELIFQMANASGMSSVNGKSLPTFDYGTKIYFGFSEFESADLVRTIEKFLFMPATFKKTFFHKSGKDPKTINFDFGLDSNGMPQAKLQVVCDNDRNARTCQIYLKESELEILKHNLKLNYTI